MRRFILAFVFGGAFLCSLGILFSQPVAANAGGMPGWIASSLPLFEQSNKPAVPLGTGVVQEPVVNVRSGPGTTFAVVGTVTRGETLLILKELGQWYQVRFDTGQTGWVANWLVSLPSRDGSKVVTSFPANLRTGPGTDYAVVRTAATGETFSLGRVADGWYELLRNGTPEGWMASWLVTVDNPPGGEQPLAGKTIVVDPGHGNVNLQWGVVDRGATGPNGLMEKDINLDLARRVIADLTGKGARVIITRNSDGIDGFDGESSDLAHRVEVANGAKADLFVSIHANSATRPEVGGTATYYYSGANQTTVRIANMVQQELVASLGRRDIGCLGANYFVLRETTMPAVLAEVMFLSNPEEERLLNLPAVRGQVAAAITAGIERHFRQP
ncbi:MAG: N-acetylmuramoyl-L-alanine amidase [Heliobacteriaceae bacterium]|nr:N-acetylmuramoyl-L-alanine amidase [Heliobacteriaceae bacterium]MDD4587426.1 N-acetylmuramoyl-L-alanine amidase [Heliobacteriaceae bacterium]